MFVVLRLSRPQGPILSAKTHTELLWLAARGHPTGGVPVTPTHGRVAPQLEQSHNRPTKRWCAQDEPTLKIQPVEELKNFEKSMMSKVRRCIFSHKPWRFGFVHQSVVLFCRAGSGRGFGCMVYFLQGGQALRGEWHMDAFEFSLAMHAWCHGNLLVATATNFVVMECQSVISTMSMCFISE